MFFFLFSRAFSATKYSAVVDCGSSGSRVYVYSYDNSEKWPKITYINDKSFDIKLADGAKNETIITELVSGVNKYVKKKIGEENLDSTKIFMYATGGMRLLSEDDQKLVIERTISELKSQTKFIVEKESIRVITGTEEGLFIWLAFNHATNGFDSKLTYGAMDMGGASSQIAMEIEKSSHKKDNDDYRLLSVKNVEREIFSHSFLGLGVNELSKSIKDLLIKESTEEVVSSPCFSNGYNETYNEREIVGKTDHDKCRQLVKRVFKPIMGDIVIPKYREGTEKYYGIGCFDSFPEVANISTLLTLPEILQGSKNICKMTFAEAVATGNEYASTNCLTSVYIYELLKDGYNFDDSFKFNFTKKIDNVKISWTMGALIDDLYDMHIAGSSSNKAHIGLYVSIGIACTVLVIAVVIFIVYRLKKKDSSDKEIYNSMQ